MRSLWLTLGLVVSLASPAAAARWSRNRRPTPPLPAVAQTPAATAVRKLFPRIETYRLRSLEDAAARTPADDAKDLAYDRAIERRVRSIARRVRAKADPRPVLIVFESHDGGGKSGTIRRIKPGLEELGTVVEVHTGAPPPGDTRHWLARSRDKLPKAGEVGIWDRSWYGGVVYDPHFEMIGKAETRQRYREIRAFERELAKDFRLVKIFLDAGDERLAETIGKREAVAPEKLSDNDYNAFRDRKAIRRLFKAARKQTDGKDGSAPWDVADMDDRGAGREQILDIIERRLAG